MYQTRRVLVLTTGISRGKFPALLDSRFRGNSRPVLFNKWRHFLEKKGLFGKFCFKNAIKRGHFRKKQTPPFKKFLKTYPLKFFENILIGHLCNWKTFLYRINTTGICREILGNKEAIIGNSRFPGTEKLREIVNSTSNCA